MSSSKRNDHDSMCFCDRCARNDQEISNYLKRAGRRGGFDAPDPEKIHNSCILMRRILTRLSNTDLNENIKRDINRLLQTIIELEARILEEKPHSSKRLKNFQADSATSHSRSKTPKRQISLTDLLEDQIELQKTITRIVNETKKKRYMDESPSSRTHKEKDITPKIHKSKSKTSQHTNNDEAIIKKLHENMAELKRNIHKIKDERDSKTKRRAATNEDEDDDDDDIDEDYIPDEDEYEYDSGTDAQYDDTKNMKKTKTTRRAGLRQRKADNEPARCDDLSYNIHEDQYRQFDYKSKNKHGIHLQGRKKYQKFMSRPVKISDKFDVVPGIGKTYCERLVQYIDYVYELINAAYNMEKDNFKGLLKCYANVNSYYGDMIYMSCRNHYKKFGDSSLYKDSDSYQTADEYIDETSYQSDESDDIILGMKNAKPRK